MTFDDIDVTDLDVFADRYPAEWFSFLREHAPVFRHKATEGSDNEEFWLVTSYEHITEVHRSGLTYSHQTGPGREGAGGIALTDVEPVMGPGVQMVMTDPPKHTAYRKTVNAGFTPRMVRRLNDAMLLRTTQVLDGIAERGECDFVTDVAAQLPLMAIAEIVGVPEADREKLFDWSNRVMGSQDAEYGDQASAEEGEQAYNTVMLEMGIYANGLTEEKKKAPADDLWSRLTEAVVTLEDGTRAELSELERDMFFVLLIVAGNETTRNSISKGFMAFMEHPDQWALLCEKGDEVADTMVDEVLRYTSPVNFFRRTATEDTVLGGQNIKAGEKVVLWYPSGNRDAAEFGPDADDFDITRTPNHHMAFGAGGPHFCLGANLAKLEIKLLFTELAKRMPDIAHSGPVDRLRMNLVDGIKHMPSSFTPTTTLL